MSPRQTVKLFLVAMLWLLSLLGVSVAQSSAHQTIKPSLIHVQATANNASGIQKIYTTTGFLVSNSGLVLTVSNLLSELGDVNLLTLSVHAGLDASENFPLNAIVVDSNPSLHLLLLRVFGQLDGHPKVSMGSATGLDEDSDIFTSGFSTEGTAGYVSDESKLKSKLTLDGLWATKLDFQGQQGGPVYDDDGVVIGVAGGKLKPGDEKQYFIPIELAEILLAPARIEQVQTSVGKIEGDLKDPHRDPVLLGNRLTEIETEIDQLQRQFSWELKSEVDPGNKLALRLRYEKILPSKLRPDKVRVKIVVSIINNQGDEKQLYSPPDELSIELDPTSDPLARGFFEFPREVVDAIEAVRRAAHGRLLIRADFVATFSDNTNLDPKHIVLEK